MGVERRGRLGWLTGRGNRPSERTAFKRQVPDWADREEPYEVRVSRTVLWGPGGAIPPGYPTSRQVWATELNVSEPLLTCR